MKISLQSIWSKYHNSCEFNKVFSHRMHKDISRIFFTTFTITNFIMYTCILFMLKKKQNLIISAKNSENNMYTKVQKKMTKVMACVFITFYVSYLPNILTVQNFISSDQIHLRSMITRLSFIFYYFNSVINPVTYLLLMTPFRNAVKTLICSGKELMNSSTILTVQSATSENRLN